MKLILLNGPPRSGKDTGAKALYYSPLSQSKVILLDRFSMPIKRAFAGTMCTNIDEFGNVNGFEAKKDEPLHILGGGKSYRQWQIDFSEKFMKPFYGEKIFARLLIARHLHPGGTFPDHIIVIPDCGFQIEVDEAIAFFGSRNTLLLRIHRPGYDFSSDSRGYVVAPETSTSADLYNDSTQEHFEAEVLDFISDWLTETQ